MAVFGYECLTRQGQLLEGQIQAENAAQAVERIKSMGFSVLEVKEIKKKRKNRFFSMGKRVDEGELTLFSRQLATMLGAGIPVTRAIDTLSRQAVNPTFKKALRNIVGNIEGGMSLSDAFGAYPGIFSNLYLAMIHAGEIGGLLDTFLYHLADQLEKEKLLKGNIKSATSYPKGVGIFAFLIFLAMLLFFVPIFRGFIPDNVELNGATAFIFNLSDSVRSFWYMWLLGSGLAAAGIVFFFKGNPGKALWEKTKLKLPLFGPLILKSVIARFTRTLATLLEGGIPVVQALESAGPSSGSDLVASAVSLAVKRIEEGKSIASTLEESNIFPPLVTHMIAVGEETGALPRLLDKVAELYEQEVDTETKGLQTLVQPIALILIGVLVGGMLIALYSPIFSTITSFTGE